MTAAERVLADRSIRQIIEDRADQRKSLIDYVVNELTTTPFDTVYISCPETYAARNGCYSRRWPELSATDIISILTEEGFKAYSRAANGVHVELTLPTKQLR